MLDLGSGFDCFLASRQVGEAGRVIGVDMTPEMVSRARANATKGGFTNTDFRLGEIEHLPISNQTVDVIISNCVINLFPAKHNIRNGETAAGRRTQNASSTFTAMLTESGFTDAVVEPKEESKTFIKDWVPGSSMQNYIASAVIKAVKP